MKKIISILSLHLFISFAFAKISVMATIPAFGLIAKDIGQDHIIVENLFDKPIDPHHFHLKPQQLSLINNSDLIIAAAEFSNKIPISSEKIISLCFHGHPSCNHSHEEEHHHHDHDDSVTHEWLSFEHPVELANKITEKLSSIDPSSADFYHHNLEKFKSKILNLLNFYKNKQLIHKNIFFHDSFSHLKFELDKDFGPGLYACDEGTLSASFLAELIENQKKYQFIIIDATTNQLLLEKLEEKIKLPTKFLETMGYGDYESFNSFLENILSSIA